MKRWLAGAIENGHQFPALERRPAARADCSPQIGKELYLRFLADRAVNYLRPDSVGLYLAYAPAARASHGHIPVHTV
jgi:hypothetical protein